MEKTIENLVKEFPLFEAFTPDQIHTIAGCGLNKQFGEGEFVFREGEPANEFYLLRHGKVALELYVPHRGAFTVQTLDAGEIVGWSWLFEPYRWHFDARVVEPARVTALDGKCLREKCDQDPSLGYEVLKVFAHIAIERLHAVRLQVLDVYGAVS